jgi:hypothetical protein
LTGAAGAPFQVEEVFAEENDLLVLSLGFVSAENPLDVIHIVCGREKSGREPPPVEDLLYIERTDQSLACDGRDVVSLAGYDDRIVLALTPEGARTLSLSERTVFRFDQHPDLIASAIGILAAMVSAGQEQVTVSNTLAKSATGNLD